MSDEVSNVNAGVKSGRQDDKRDGRKPPQKGPSKVKKRQKLCYICRKPGHLQKDCPCTGAFRSMVNMLTQDLPASAGQRLRTGPGPSRRRRIASRIASRATNNGAEQQQQQQQDHQQQNQQQQDHQQQEEQQQNESDLPDRTKESWADQMDEDENSKNLD